MFWGHLRRKANVRLFLVDKVEIVPPFSSFSEFPVLHKVGNVGIFVQVLMEINWKHLELNPFQFTFVFWCFE